MVIGYRTHSTAMKESEEPPFAVDPDDVLHELSNEPGERKLSSSDCEISGEIRMLIDHSYIRIFDSTSAIQGHRDSRVQY
ncbi:hypothetical protein L596_022833 [Steinernema carpocapsae]|uniref:Uncharacterized protein n=1 Tax=Steinernema carpocapsae TaxID=34508 RepID=A0A4U5MMY6_STECR|nr:hypothetical protein L596_022833 [Steinernema carpocapsae]